VKEHQAHRVESITKVVSDDRHGDREPDRRRHLERQADTHTIHEAVADQRERRQDADARMAVRGIVGLVHAVDEHEFLEPMEQQEGDDQGDHGRMSVVSFLRGELEDFRQQIERDHTQQNARGEPQEQMQSVAEPECAQARPRMSKRM
jgi:hypothetical protein